jgi:hypothetical protein
MMLFSSLRRRPSVVVGGCFRTSRLLHALIHVSFMLTDRTGQHNQTPPGLARQHALTAVAPVKAVVNDVIAYP